ncbi:MAG: LacI family DNA-binding transcriptional regulator [Brooklawnia sp.]
MSGRVRIDDVAREAGVSIATVSRVLNGKGRVNPQMTELVRAAAERLGYRPNVLAQGLATGEYRTIGVVVPDLGNPYFTDILSTIVADAADDGFRVVISDARGSASDELNACLQYRPYVDGLIVVSPRMSAADLAVLAAEQLPVVLVNRHEPGIELPAVLADTRSATVELCRHLAELGHRRVAYIAGPESSWQNSERLAGLDDARELGITSVVIASEGTIQAGHDAAEQALGANPTAILAFNDLAAIGVMTRLNELGLQVPRDISVAGFDDIEVARYVRPALTTAVSPKTQLGGLAWQALCARLRGADADSSRASSPVIVRESTGPASS